MAGRFFPFHFSKLLFIGALSLLVRLEFNCMSVADCKRPLAGDEQGDALDQQNFLRLLSRGNVSGDNSGLADYFKAIESFQRIESKLDPDIKQPLRELLAAKQNQVKNKIEANPNLIMMRALAGKDNSRSLGGYSPADGWDAFKMGMEVRMIDSVCDVAAKRVEAAAEKTVGSAWDYCINKVLAGWLAMWSWMFYGSKEPLSVKKIENLHSMVDKTFEDVRKLLNDDLIDRSKSLDMTQRSVEGDVQEEAKQNVVWLSLVARYGEQLDYFASLLMTQLEVYRDNQHVLFAVGQIKSHLLTFRQWLISCKSPKDLDALLSSNKNIINAIRNNISTLFSSLVDEIALPSAGDRSAGEVKYSSGKLVKKQGYHQNNDYDDDGGARARMSPW